MSIAPSFKMTFIEYKANFFSEVDKGLKRDLSRLGAYCRKTAKNSIKDARRLSKKKRRESRWRRDRFTGVAEPYSREGQPPLSKTGLLKKFILFAWDNSTKSAVVGAAKFKDGNVPHALEYGGVVNIATWEGGHHHVVSAYIRPRPYMRPALAETQKYLPKVFQDALDKGKGFNNLGYLANAA